MKVFKPHWINHDGMSICSIDIHPDGSRVATGGQGGNSGRIVIWNFGPVADEQKELDEAVPRMLCQLDNHLACVNCVRWSGSGRYLASGGDDKLIMVWTMSKTLGGTKVFGSKGKINLEGWRCSQTLRGHNGDVLDMAWSPNDSWLATCSIDNTVIVWKAENFPEIVTVLKGHTGLVKGVSWDPVGKYLGSQSDDKTVRIWRTCDWATEKVIKKPFSRTSGTTMVLRLSWSPDGQALVTAHAMNGEAPTAQIIERDGWESSKDFVGHLRAVTCARFSTAITEVVKKGKTVPACLCALGSRDCSVSVWMTTLERPLTVMQDLFSSSVLDIGWSPSGRSLMACSADGTTAYIEFTSVEVGRSISEPERCQMLERLYGKVNFGEGNDLIVVENPELLRGPIENNVEDEESIQIKMEVDDTQQERAPFPAPPPLNGTSSLPPSAKRTNKQIETRTSDGRRRITPITIPLNSDSAEEIIPFSADSMPSFSSCMSKSRIVVEKRDDVVVIPNVTPAKSISSSANLLNANSCTTPVKSTPNTSNLTDSPNKTESSPGAFSGLISPVKKASGKIRPSKSHRRNAKTAPIGKVRSSEKVIQKSPQPLPPLALTTSSDIKLWKSRNYASVENSVSSGNQGVISIVRLFSPDNPQPLWELALGSEVVGLTGGPDFVVVATTDRSLRFLDPKRGTHLCPPVPLDSFPSLLSLCEGHVLSITTSGSLSVWSSSRGLPLAVISNKSVAPLIPSEGELRIKNCLVTQSGDPVLALTSGKAFLYSITSNCWFLVADNNDPVLRRTQLSYRNAVSSPSPSDGEILPLKSVQAATLKGSTSHGSRITFGSDLGPMCTLTFLDTQLASAKALNSKTEYKFWLLTLVRFLVQQGIECRLRKICEDLLGPSHSASTNNLNSSWNKQVLGLNKHSLLREVLKEISSNLKLQRLYTEIFSQLDPISK